MSRRAASADEVRTRTAVARGVSDLRPGDVVIVGCSGGADSLALTAAAAWVAAHGGPRAVAVVVDHGLQDGSAQAAARAADAARALGADSAEVVTVHVGTRGGPEAAARDARYAALDAARDRNGAAAVLLGHTREDQAETVLLRLARGSGAASLAAMRSVNGAYRRPFLDLPRSVVRAAADRALAPLGVHPWQDPHNDDTAYARVRVRSALAILVDALGDGVVAGLARSADLLAADADALDAVADAAFADLVEMGGDTVSVDCGHLAAVARAVRTRIVRAMAVTAGVPRDRLTRDHVIAVCALVEDWRGQGAVSLPGAVVARRAYGRLWLAAAPSDGGHERTDDVDG